MKLKELKQLLKEVKEMLLFGYDASDVYKHAKDKGATGHQSVELIDIARVEIKDTGVFA